MKTKRWLKYTVLFFIISSSLLYLLIYKVDPYGYFSKKDKYIYNLTHIDYPNIIHNKILMQNDLYLLGSSRQMRINPLRVEEYSNKSVQCIAQMTSTLDDNLFLVKQIKAINKNFIYSFDAFTLNNSRMKSNVVLKNRLQIYKNEFNSNKNIYFNLFDMDILFRSIEHIYLKIKSKKYNYQEVDENNKISFFNKIILNRTFSSLQNDEIINLDFSGLFKHYKAYPDYKIIQLAKLANKADIFVIYPKQAYYYTLFQKYEHIEKQYFHMIKVLVNNTDAKVVSFYDINDITRNQYNFDIHGWHFKPKIG